MLKKLTKEQIALFLSVGVKKAIEEHRQELADLEALAKSMDGNPKKPAADKPKRTISAKHKAALSLSMRRRWAKAKKAGKKLQDGGI